MLPSDLDAQFGTPYPRSAGFDTDIGAFIESSSVSSPLGPMAPLIINNDEVQGETFLPGQIFVFGGFALRANSLGRLEQIESYAPGHQVRFGSLNYTADIRGDLIFDGFERQPSAPHYLEGHDITLPPNSALEAAHAPALILGSEPAASFEDERLDVTSGAAILKAIEPNAIPALRTAHDSKESDSFSSPETPSPLPIESDWAPIMEFTAADIFQHSPFGDILNSLKSLSLSGEPRPNYGLRGWDSDDEEIQSPPTTHLIATVDDLTDMLDFGSEDFDGMDDEGGEEQEPAPVGRWTATSSYDIYMVDAPKDGDGNGTAEDGTSRKPPKRRRQRRRSKSRQSMIGDSGTGDNTTPDSAEEHQPQQDSAQEDGEASPHERAAEQEVEDDNYMPPSEDEASLGDDEFVVPSDPAEQERFQRKLIAAANSLKKKQQQLRADQDLLADRWTEVLAAEEYELGRPSKNYPKHRLLPLSEEEAQDMADRPPRGRDRETCRTTKQAMPRRRFTKARENEPDLRSILEDKARQTRSIYGSRGRPNFQFGQHKSGRAENNKHSSAELRNDIAQYRGAAHPLCFTDEVMDHKIPEGFKPINIESYDGTTDPAVWIEDYLLHIHMARGDELHAIKYLPLKLKGPARHWLNSLPADSIGSWEDLEATFLDNFQGTYVRPPDADDLSHIIQQPDESARQFWTRFLRKKNQIVYCPDAEALAAFKHNIRDEWLARHLGQEKPKSMAALTTLMTRFCAGEDSWLARSNNLPKNPGNWDNKDKSGRSRRSNQ